MNTIVSPTASPSTFSSPKLFKTHDSSSPFSSSNIAFPRYSNLKGIGFPCKKGSFTSGVRCNSSIWPGGPGSGDGDSSSRSILDAFFLGKAVAEALNERIESSVGEFLSTVGRLQAEQQKQVQEFQEEVLDRAKKAKEKAAREAMEAQGLVSKSSVETKVTDSGTTRTSYSSTDPAAASQSVDASETYADASKEEEPPLSSSNDD